MPSPNVGGPLSVVRVLDVRDINIKAEACNLHQFTLWDDLICYMIEQAKMREFLLTANANNYKIFECPLVHLGYTSYRHLSCGWNYETWTKRRIVLSLAHNKDSKPWTLSCGESLLSFPRLVCKSSFNMKELLSHVFTTAGLDQLNLFSSTLGMVWPGIKMIQTEYRLVSVGVSVGPAYFPSKTRKSKFQACMSSVKGTPKAHKKERK